MTAKSMNDCLMEVTKNLPMRLIEINDTAYIERYYVGSNRRGEQTWIHRFLSADGDRNFHSHPWYADATIVCGGYMEASVFKEELNKHHIQRFAPGDTNMINPTTLHKITSIEPLTWTVLQVKPNWGTWYFIDDEGKVKEMGKTHNEEWWMIYSPREIQ